MDEHAQDSEELAQDRTDLAEDRTLLANERTYASWVRTGLAAIGVALGFRALLHNVEPAWAVRSVATVFVLAGAAMIWLSHRRALAVVKRLDRHSIRTLRTSRMTWLSGSLVLASLAVVVLLWMV